MNVFFIDPSLVAASLISVAPLMSCNKVDY